MLNLKVINLWCGPGGGKSTTAAGLFNLMKTLGLEVELVTEFAKDLTYERNFGSLENQLLVLAQQDARLRRLVGQVEWAITDSPLPLCEVYMTPEYQDFLPDAILGAYERYDNYDFYVRRSKTYRAGRRFPTEHQALTLDFQIADLFREYTEPHRAWWIDGGSSSPNTIARHLGLQ